MPHLTFPAIEQFNLQRLPHTQDKSLRAWDAADEYLLSHLAEHHQLYAAQRILLINDQFGALACALSSVLPKIEPGSSLFFWSDSYVSQQACQLNLAANQIDADIDYIAATDLPETYRNFDLVLIKVPHNLSLLEQQLYSVRSCLSEQGRVIAAAMVKQVQQSSLALFGRILGETKTSLAKKKARLIFSEYDAGLEPALMPYPTYYEQCDYGLKLYHHGNVFSRKSLDIGARAFIESFGKLFEQCQTSVSDIADLGCGNGILGIMAQRYLPEARIDFFDESYAAVSSARLNYQQAFGQEQQARFIWSNCFPGELNKTYDVILCNPPFHQQRVLGDFIAWSMMKQSLRALKRGGELWLVGNRHLAYHQKFKRLFGHYKLVHSTNKFVVLKAVKK